MKLSLVLDSRTFLKTKPKWDGLISIFLLFIKFNCDSMKVFPNFQVLVIRLFSSLALRSSQFKLSCAMTNVEYHSFILRMYRNHIDLFQNNDLLRLKFAAIKRYKTHTMPLIWHDIFHDLFINIATISMTTNVFAYPVSQT